MSRAKTLSRAVCVVGSPRRYSVSAEEMKHFTALADSWWDVKGSQRILHKMNLLRLDYVRSVLASAAGPHVQLSSHMVPPQIASVMPTSTAHTIQKNLNETFSEIRVLDVGCGGGIFAEAMARQQFVASVTGIDANANVIATARAHQSRDPVLTEDRLSYQHTQLDTVEASEQYDIVSMFEVLEHVDSPAQMVTQAFARLKAGGWLFLSTINRTPISYLTTIATAEYLLQIVPRGTHTYSKYINESELRDFLLKDPLVRDQVAYVQSDGCCYVPVLGEWRITPSWMKSTGNYFMAVQKK